jgi:hypothetical protein
MPFTFSLNHILSIIADHLNKKAFLAIYPLLLTFLTCSIRSATSREFVPEYPVQPIPQCWLYSEIPYSNGGVNLRIV